MNKINPLNSNSYNNSNLSVQNPLLYDLIHKDISKQKVSKLLENLAQVAYSLGETNEPQKYAEELGEHIFEALEEYKKKIKKKK